MGTLTLTVGETIPWGGVWTEQRGEQAGGRNSPFFALGRNEHEQMLHAPVAKPSMRGGMYPYQMSQNKPFFP